MPAYPGAVFDLQVQRDGTLMDVVSGTAATLARGTEKWGIDPDTGRLVKTEGSGTNQILNSGFTIDTDGNGMSDSWNPFTSSGAATIEGSRDTSGEFVSQRIICNRVDGTSGTTYPAVSQSSASGTFAPGDCIVASYEYRNLSKSGVAGVTITVKSLTSAGAQVDQVAVSLTPSSDGVWRRAFAVIPVAGANTSKAGIYVLHGQTADADYFDLEIRKAQLEKVPAGWLGPTGWIATTTAAASRPALLAPERAVKSYPLANPTMLDVSGDGSPDQWIIEDSGSATPTLTVTDGVARVQYTPAAESGKYVRLYQRLWEYLPGDMVKATVLVKNLCVGCTFQVSFMARTLVDVYVAESNVTVPYSEEWQTVTLSYIVPATAQKLDLHIRTSSDVDQGDTVDFYVDTVTLEKSQGHPGLWARFEPARTNYALNSDFALDTNADGVPDSWTLAFTAGSTTPTYSRNTTDPMFGTVQKVRYDHKAGTATDYPNLQFTGAVGDFVQNDVVCASIWYRNLQMKGANVTLNVRGYNATLSANYNSTSLNLIPSQDGIWRRAYVHVALAADAAQSRASMRVQQTQSADGDWWEGEFCCPQLEKGWGASSWIQTAATTMTRAADIVSFPTSMLDKTQGTVIFAAGIVNLLSYAALWGIMATAGNANRMALYQFSGARRLSFPCWGADGTASDTDTLTSDLTLPHQVTQNPNIVVGAGRWKTDGSYASFADTKWASQAGDGNADLAATQYIGGRNVAGYEWGGYIHRVLGFATALSDAEVTSIRNTDLLGGIRPPHLHYANMRRG